MQKVTEQELKSLRESVNKVNQLQIQIGGIEVQKHELLHALDLGAKDLQATQSGLQEKYGDVTIDLETGEIKENEPNKED